MRLVCPVERLGEGEGLVAIAAGDGEDLRLGAALRMDVECAAIRDGEALGSHRLDALIIGAGSDGALDLGAQQILEHAEQPVLQIDSQREEPVEKGGDRRQILAQAAVAIGQPQAGRVLERLQRAALDLAAVKQEIELAQRRAAIDGFEIVGGAEQTLAAGLALAPGDGAERVEAARDRTQEALLGLDVGGDRPEQRRLRLVGAVGAAETLDRGIGLPARFQQVVDAQTAVLRGQIGMIGTAGAAGVGEDQNALLVIHEGLRLGEIGRAGAGSRRREPVALAHDAPRAAGHFRHHLRAEAVQDLVERALDRGKRGEALDHAVARFDGLAALNRIAVAIDGPGREIALAVGERLEQLGRKAVRQIIENIFALMSAIRD